jgi:hypothetical protein
MSSLPPRSQRYLISVIPHFGRLAAPFETSFFRKTFLFDEDMNVITVILVSSVLPSLTTCFGTPVRGSLVLDVDYAASNSLPSGAMSSGVENNSRVLRWLLTRVQSIIHTVPIPFARHYSPLSFAFNALVLLDAAAALWDIPTHAEKPKSCRPTACVALAHHHRQSQSLLEIATDTSLFAALISSFRVPNHSGLG